MAKLLPIIVMLLACSLVLCAQTPVEKFISNSFEPDQNVTTTALAGGYTLISADGMETYVVDSSGNEVTDNATLQGVLAADAQSSGGFDGIIASAESFASQVNGTKEANEAQCMQYTGLNMHNCTDKQSCIVACFAVPQCNLIVEADGFIGAMQDWNGQRLQFDSDISSFSDNIDAIKTDSSAVGAKLSILNDMGTLAQGMEANPIFLNGSDPQCLGSNGSTCFDYCPKIDYSISEIAAQEQNLQSLKAVLANVSQQPARASAILAQGEANDNYLSTRAANFNAFSQEMSGSLANLTSEDATFARSVKDDNASSMLASLSNLSESINAEANAGYYRQAMAQQSAYDGAEQALSERMGSELAAYENLTGGFSATAENINKSAPIIGNQSAAQYFLAARVRRAECHRAAHDGPDQDREHRACRAGCEPHAAGGHRCDGEPAGGNQRPKHAGGCRRGSRRRGLAGEKQPALPAGIRNTWHPVLCKRGQEKVGTSEKHLYRLMTIDCQKEVILMKGRLVNYRQGVHTVTNNQYVVKVEGVADRASANGIIGKRVVWKTITGKEIVGKINKAHGNSGAVLARFDKGLPGQAIGTEVEIS